MERLGFLDVEATERYSRQISMEEVGMAGQQKLAHSAVLVVGAGGLGSPIIYYLAATGVGRIGIVDHDLVSLSNLQRQILYTSEDVGKSKVEVAAHKACRLNPSVKIEPYNVSFCSDNAHAMAEPYQLIIDASDNYATRLLIDRVTAEQGKPFIYGSISGFTGQCAIFNAPSSPIRYVRLFPDLPEDGCAATIGVLGSTAGVVGSIQVSEAIKWLLGLSSPLSNHLLSIDLHTLQFSLFSLQALQSLS